MIVWAKCIKTWGDEEPYYTVDNTYKLNKIPIKYGKDKGKFKYEIMTDLDFLITISEGIYNKDFVQY